MRVLICGSRDYANGDRVMLVLGIFHNSDPVTCVIEGEARGADTLGRIAAEKLRIPVEKYPADWKKYGKSAGAIRNRQMLEEGKPDIVLAFFSNIFEPSKGTADMVKIARERGVRVELFV